MRKLNIGILAILFLCLPLSAQGSQDSGKENEAASSEGILKRISVGSETYPIYLSINGYVDTYYSFNFNKDAEESPQRIFDSAHNEFRLGLVQTKFEVGNDDWGVVADLVHGPNAELGNFGNVDSEGKSLTSSAVKQAYANVSMWDFTLTVGQYNTHIGYEVIEASLNSHYSLSNLFGYGPFYHVGAKLDYAIMEELAVMIGVTNGWDAAGNFDINSGKSITAQVGIAFLEGLDIYLNYMGGDESEEDGGWRNIYDLTSTYELNDSLKFGLNGAVGTDSLAENVDSKAWFGAAFYIDYIFNPEAKHTYMLSVRNEYFSDKDGVRGFAGGVGAYTYGLTVTGTASLYNGGFLIKPEVRFDLSDKAIYANAQEDQVTFAVSFIGVY